MSSNMFPDADIASLTIGLFEYKGAYNAATNTPDLDSTPITIAKGDSYNVSAAGLFFTEYVSIGDVMTATVDNPTTLAQWVIVQDNIEEEEITPVVATTYTIESKDSVIEVRTDEIFGVTGSRASAASVGSATTRASMPFVPSRPAASSIGSTASVASGATEASTPSTASAGSSVAVASNASVASSPNTASAGSVAAVSSQAALAAQPVSITLRDGQRPVDIDVVGTSASYVELLPISGSTIDGKNKFVFHGTAGEESARAYQYGGTHDVDFGVMMSPDANTGGTIQNANLSIQAADEGTVAGDARPANAVDLQTDRANSDEVAKAIGSAIVGGNDNKISWDSTQGFIAAGAQNLLSSAAKAFVTGWANTVSALYATCIGGYYNTAAHKYACVVGRNAVSIAESSNVEASQCGAVVVAEHRFRQGGSITTSSETELFSGNGGVERLVIPASKLCVAEGEIGIQDSADHTIYDSWKFTATMKRDAASALTLVAFSLTPLVQTTKNTVRLACDENTADEFAIFVTIPNGTGRTNYATATYKIHIG